jgi:hypothetical protein
MHRSGTEEVTVGVSCVRLPDCMDPWETHHRMILLRRTGGACAFCGTAISAGFGNGWSVARWISGRELWGSSSVESTDVPGNLWAVCAQCADDKGDLDGRQYIEWRMRRGLPVHPRWEAYAKVAEAVLDARAPKRAGGGFSSDPPRSAS